MSSGPRTCSATKMKGRVASAGDGSMGFKDGVSLGDKIKSN